MTQGIIAKIEKLFGRVGTRQGIFFEDEGLKGCFKFHDTLNYIVVWWNSRFKSSQFVD